MSGWTPDAVLAAAAAWAWVPSDADQVLTGDYQVIAYPGHYLFPTQVAWSRSARPASELVGEITAQASRWGRDRLYWWISDATSPADTEATLRDHGASLETTVQVLACDMSEGLPALDVPHDARARIVRDEPDLRAFELVSGQIWQSDRKISEAEFARELAETKDELSSWSGFRVVVFLDGSPASAGGCTLAGSVARMWGAGTLPAYRGRGGYRALLAARLVTAQQQGMTLALVKGKVETSGPILRRAGFAAYGTERCYRLDI